MTIRVENRKRFAIIDSRTVNDDRLSMRARGVLVWLLDKPDGWRVSADAIARATTEGRDAIRTALKELEEHGYLRRERYQDDQGRWSTESVVSELGSEGLEHPGHDRRRDSRRRETSAGSTDVGETDDGIPGPLATTQSKDDEPVPMSPASTPDVPVKPAVAALDKLPKAVDPDAVRRLCLVLRDAVGEHHPTGGKPKVTPQWVKDMGTLLNSGAEGWEGRAPSEADVQRMIATIFSTLATPDGRGFCWANQVRSPGALRRHWTKVEAALATRARGPAAAATDVSKIAADAAKLQEVLGR